jgi:hypothetical protein
MLSLAVGVGLFWPNNLAYGWAVGVALAGPFLAGIIGFQGQKWPVHHRTKEPFTAIQMSRHANIYGFECAVLFAGALVSVAIRIYMLAAIVFDFACLFLAVAVAASWKLSHSETGDPYSDQETA